MEKMTFELKNKGLGEYNDAVVEKSFELNTDYSVIVQPDALTQFWRFGFVFSNKPDFIFTPNDGRYKDGSLRFLQINIGERNNGTWEYPDWLQVQTYYVDDTDGLLDRIKNYIPHGPVQCRLRRLSKDTIEFALLHKGEEKTFPIFIGDRPYFRLFAWADFLPFTVSVDIGPVEQEATNSRLVDLENNARSKTWILFLNTSTWDIASFSHGANLWHGAYDGQNKKRPEYNLYQKIRPNDRIIGISFGEYTSVVAQFVVTKALYSDEKNGEVINFSVSEVFTPYIAVEENGTTMDFLLRFQARPQLRLMEGSSSIWQEVMRSNLAFPRIPITFHERFYLQALYLRFESGLPLESPYALKETWHDLPAGFNPTEMNTLLAVAGTQITLLGLAQVAPASILFWHFEKIAFAIKSILGKGGVPSTISSEEILAICPAIPLARALQVVQLMQAFRAELMMGMGTKQDGSFTINVGRNEILDTYKSFTGLRVFMREYISKNAPEFLAPSPAETAADSPAGTFRRPTRFKQRHVSDFNAVMGVKTLAADISRIITEMPGEKGQMIGLFGRWGRGKTFLLDEVWKQLKQGNSSKFVRVDFQAWKYQETPASWAYVYERFAEGFLGKTEDRKWWQYYPKLIRLNIARKGWLPIVSFASLIVMLLAWSVYSIWFSDLDKITIVTSNSVFVLSIASLLSYLNKKLVPTATQLVKKYGTQGSFRPTLGLQAEIQEELIKLLEVWIPEQKASKKKKKGVPAPLVKIMLMVEDIDRCYQDKITPIIDSLRVLLDDEKIASRVIIVITIDDRLLKSAIKQKYKKLDFTEAPVDGDGSNEVIYAEELIAEYIDKLFILAVKLGALSDEHTRDYIKELVRRDVAQRKDIQNSVVIEDSLIPRSTDAKATKEQSSEPDRDSPSGPEIELAAESPTPAIEPWEPIQPWEVELLEKALLSWNNVTPRKMKIFYYRYLLCKNLIIARYIAENRPNVWNDENGVRLLLELIKKNSTFPVREPIPVHRTKVAKMNDEDLPFYEMGFAVTKRRTDYLLLLDILELIVAY